MARPAQSNAVRVEALIKYDFFVGQAAARERIVGVVGNTHTPVQGAGENRRTLPPLFAARGEGRPGGWRWAGSRRTQDLS